MHVLAKLLQPLFVLHAEMLLLIDDQKAEIGELDTLGEQRVGADDDVDVARLDARLAPRRAPSRLTSREACAIFTGKPRKRSVKVW